MSLQGGNSDRIVLTGDVFPMSLVTKFLFALYWFLLPIISSMYANPISCREGLRLECVTCPVVVICENSDGSVRKEGLIDHSTPIKRMIVTIRDNRGNLRTEHIPNPPETTVPNALQGNFSDGVLDILKLRPGEEARVEGGGLFLDDSTMLYEDMDISKVESGRGGRTLKQALSSGETEGPCMYEKEPSAISYRPRNREGDNCTDCYRIFCVGKVSCSDHPDRGSFYGATAACDATSNIDIDDKTGSCPTATECVDDLSTPITPAPTVLASLPAPAPTRVTAPAPALTSAPIALAPVTAPVLPPATARVTAPATPASPPAPVVAAPAPVPAPTPAPPPVPASASAAPLITDSSVRMDILGNKSIDEVLGITDPSKVGTIGTKNNPFTLDQLKIIEDLLLATGRYNDPIDPEVTSVTGRPFRPKGKHTIFDPQIRAWVDFWKRRGILPEIVTPYDVKRLVAVESSFDSDAENPRSTATGPMQLLDGSLNELAGRPTRGRDSGIRNNNIDITDEDLLSGPTAGLAAGIRFLGAKSRYSGNNTFGACGIYRSHHSHDSAGWRFVERMYKSAPGGYEAYCNKEASAEIRRAMPTNA